MSKNENFIKSFSEFTKINEAKVRNYLENSNIRTLVEHPNTIDPTPNQLANFNNLKTLSNLYTRLSKYQEYKFEKTSDMAEFLNSHFENQFEKEHFVVAYLDEANKVLGVETISIGTLNASIVHPRDVFKQAIHYNSKRMVLSHNHPSSDPTPSVEDFNITKRLEEAGKLLNIKVLDHIVIGGNQYYSFKEKGDLSVNYDLLETTNNIHKNTYNKDSKNIIDLINKVTKIPKNSLANILNENSIIELMENPNNYLTDQKAIQNINMLKEFKSEYMKALNQQEFKINQPENVEEYMNNRYNNNDKINVALFLNTKNIIIESKIIPANLSAEKEFKFIMENAILHDSNSYILATKDHNLSPLNRNISSERINRVTSLQQKSDLFGIKLLDNVECIGNYSNSFKIQGHINETQAAYSTNKKSLPMNERFANAKAEANKRNEKQTNKSTKSKEQEI